MNSIIERQSPDWNSPDFDADKAATLLATRFYGNSAEGIRHAAYTRELYALWDCCFSIPLSHCRNFLKELAHQNWRQVKNCQRLFHEAGYQEISKTIFGKYGWILFTDDDDWFSPDVFTHIERLISQETAICVLWNRVRFDGQLTVTPLSPTTDFPLYAYTNNYAVRSDTFQTGSDVPSVMQHGFANSMIEAKLWHVFFAPGATLSVTNKSPCSWNYLDQAKKSEDPRKTLVRSVEKYGGTTVQLDDSLRWVEPYLRTAQTYFNGVLRRNLRL